jgi:capsular polysaccharide biosynthesis protein
VDFWDLTTLLFRRWYAALPLLVATAVASFATLQNVTPNYIANAYVQLIPPTVVEKTDQTPGATQHINPWMDLGLAALGNAATISLKDESVLTSLTASGYSENFTMTPNSDNLMETFEVTGTSAAQASKTADQLVKLFVQSVVDLQTAYGVQQTNLITTRRLDLGNNLTQSNSNVKRAVVAVGVAGILLTLAFTIGLDALVRRRSRRLAAMAGDEAPELRRPPTRREPAAAPASRQQQLVISPVSQSTSRPAPGPGQGQYGSPMGTVLVDSNEDQFGEPTERNGTLPVPTDATVVLPLAYQKSRGKAAESEGTQRR